MFSVHLLPSLLLYCSFSLLSLSHFLYFPTLILPFFLCLSICLTVWSVSPSVYFSLSFSLSLSLLSFILSPLLPLSFCPSFSLLSLSHSLYFLTLLNISFQSVYLSSFYFSLLVTIFSYLLLFFSNTFLN